MRDHPIAAPPGEGPARQTLRIFAAALLVGLATVTAYAARRFVAVPDLAMIYVACIMLAATALGRAAALVASLLSVAAYDFFFVPPYYTFAVSESRHLITFAMMFLVGFLVSDLMTRVRRHAQQADAATLRARTEEMRSSLLSAVSHDLRTPLAVITGAATTLRDQGASLDASQREDLVQTVCEEAERLDRLVRNLLDMTRIEGPGLEVRREWVPVEELVTTALARLEPALAGHPVKVTIEPDLPLVPCDPVLIEQVLLNLLENATKYTDAAAGIDVAARRVASGVQISVGDQGPGFVEEDLPRVFDKFYRGPKSTARGAGLGLAIVRGAVEAHGGTVSASNRLPRGAEVRIVLPIVGTPPQLPGPDAARESLPG